MWISSQNSLLLEYFNSVKFYSSNWLFILFWYSSFNMCSIYNTNTILYFMIILKWMSWKKYVIKNIHIDYILKKGMKLLFACIFCRSYSDGGFINSFYNSPKACIATDRYLLTVSLDLWNLTKSTLLWTLCLSVWNNITNCSSMRT